MERSILIGGLNLSAWVFHAGPALLMSRRRLAIAKDTAGKELGLTEARINPTALHRQLSTFHPATDEVAHDKARRGVSYRYVEGCSTGCSSEGSERGCPQIDGDRHRMHVNLPCPSAPCTDKFLVERVWRRGLLGFKITREQIPHQQRPNARNGILMIGRGRCQPAVQKSRGL